MIKLDLERILKEKNKSKYWLVQMLDSSYPVINKLVDGTATTIKFETLEKILYYLDCKPEDLIIYEKEEPKRY